MRLSKVFRYFLILEIFGLMILFSACAMDVDVKDNTLHSGTLDFSAASQFEFDENHVELVGGRFQLKALDLENSGSDFDKGSFGGAYLVGGNLQMHLGEYGELDSSWTPEWNSLVSYWKMNGDWTDERGNSHGAAVGDTSFVTGRMGQAGYFDGVGDRMEATTTGNAVFTHDTDFTMAGWFYPDRTHAAAAANNLPVVHFGCTSGYTFKVVYRDADLSFPGKITFNRYLSPGMVDGMAVVTPEMDGWNHYTITKKGSTITAYWNGQEVDSKTSVVTGGATCDTMRFAYQDYKGLIDDQALWNKALSAEDIATIYNRQSQAFAHHNELSATWTPKYTDLVGYWKMEGNWQDSSGNNNHGTATNSAALNSESKIGSQALTVSANGAGFGDYINIPSHSSFHLPGAVTQMAWVKASSFSEEGAIVRCGAGTDLQYSMYVTNVQKLRFNWYDGSFQQINSNGTLDQDRWHHIAIVRTATNMVKLYIDGVLDSSVMATQETGGGGTLDIGAVSVTPVADFDGSIDEVAIWSTSLTSADIHQIYERQKQKYYGEYNSSIFDLGEAGNFSSFEINTPLPYGKELVASSGESALDYSSIEGGLSNGLAGYWPLNETSLGQGPAGTDFADLSSSANHGSEFGGAQPGVQGLLGKGAFFDGIDDYVDLGTHSSLDIFGSYQDFSICSWINNSALDVIDPIFAWGTGSTDGGTFQTRHVTNVLVFSSPNATVRAEGTLAVPLNEWHFACVTADRDGDLSFYLDGSLDNTTDISATASESWNRAAGVYKLAASRNNGRIFRGFLDEISIWTKSLSATEVRQLYQRGANRVKYQVRSCIDSSCNCKSYSSSPAGSSSDCDGDGTPNEQDSDDIYKAKFIGPGGDGSTYYSELFNRESSDVVLDCDINTTDSSDSICVADEIFLTGSAKSSSLLFSLDSYNKPASNRYFQYRVSMEAEENQACSGKACLPELTSINLNPAGTPRYYGQVQAIVNKTPIPYVHLRSARLEADSCATFQLSVDGAQFYTWREDAWREPSSSTDGALASDVIEHIREFGAQMGPGQLYLKTFLNSDGETSCSFGDFSVETSELSSE